MDRLLHTKGFQFFLISITVILCFLFVRPLNSPWHPFIAGDGLGYYAYLPAKFIHNDPNLDFKWFNRVHNANYVYSSFDNPEDNLLVAYQGKRINKYYQGLSFLWMPFFVAGHIVAKLFHFNPDGFSPPYQYAMGFASLFYLLLGLWLLYRFLLFLFNNQSAALFAVLSIFLGTFLFNYSLFANTLSHLYSFTFVTGFLFFISRFFKSAEQKRNNLLLALLFITISFCIRPLTILCVLAVPAFFPKNLNLRGIIRATRDDKFKWQHVLFLLISLFAMTWQIWLNYIQTGHFFAYTYTDEKFNFSDARFYDAMFSYHMGLFVYAPIFLFCFAGFLFVKDKRLLLLPLLFLAILFLYSAWWYWPITKRAMIDFYAIPAIGLAALLNTLKHKKVALPLFVTLLIFSLAYFQLKSKQVRDGVLDEYLTHKELFWKHFFRLRKAHIYPVPPESIVEKRHFLMQFEDSLASCKTSPEFHCSGKKSLVLDKENYICCAASFDFPELFSKVGVRKIRLGMKLYAEQGLREVHTFLKFIGTNDKELLLIPFYIGQDYLQYDQWDDKEFGYDLTDRKLLNADSIKKIEVIIWNVDPGKRVFIDDLETDFILTNRYFETVK